MQYRPLWPGSRSNIQDSDRSSFSGQPTFHHKIVHFYQRPSFFPKSFIFSRPCTFRIVPFQEPFTFQHLDHWLSAGQSTSYQKIVNFYERPFTFRRIILFYGPSTFGIVQFPHFWPSTFTSTRFEQTWIWKPFFSDFGTHLHKNQFQSVSISFNQFFMDFVV